MASRSRKKWWKKRNPFARVKAAREPLLEHTRTLILADLEAIGGIGGWEDMERHVPGRYDRRYFDSTMEKIGPSWVKYAGRSRFFAGYKIWKLPSYKPQEAPEEEDRCQPAPSTT